MSMEIGYGGNESAVAQGSVSRQALEDVLGAGPDGASLRAALLGMARYGTQHALDEVDRAAREAQRTTERPSRAGGVEFFAAQSERATYTIELPAPFCPRVAPRVTGFRAALDAAKLYARAYGFANVVRDGRLVVTIGV